MTRGESMTPFQEDMLNFVCNTCARIIDFMLRLRCYFFGHRWGEWENADNHSFLGQYKECKICKQFDYNDQKAKTFL